MQVSLTEQLKLLANDEQRQAFYEVSSRYAMAATAVSEVYFQSGMIGSAFELQDQVYQMICFCYGLKSQMAISVVRTVVARYKSVDDQMKGTYAKYKGEDDDTWYTFRRDKNWLTRPIRNCGRTFNDDEVAARNLKILGGRYLAGEENPCFTKA